MKSLFELSGEHPLLPKAELRAVAQAEAPDFRIKNETNRTMTLDINKRFLRQVSKRLALTRSINYLLASSSGFESLLKKVAQLELPDGTFAVRGESYLKCPYTNLYMESRIGEAMSKKNRVNLQNPQHEFRIVYDGKYNLCLKAFSIDRQSFESRTPQKRPFFSPISLHPRLARVLVNLSRVRKGELLLDPFCGTGGVLIEAGLVGVRLVGNDIQVRMVSGCSTNLGHFGLNAELLTGDIGSLTVCFSEKVKKADAVATDPPYGRAATTAREDLKSLYKRTFETVGKLLKKGKYLSIVLPSLGMASLAGDRFDLCEIYDLRVHRSLTRHFCVFKAL